MCGTWEFAVDPPKDFPADRSGLKWSPIKVPAHWEMEGFAAESGRAVYRKTFAVPGRLAGQADQAAAPKPFTAAAQVWVNGQRAGGHEGGFTPFELDITDMVKPGEENEILVLVDARTMASEMDNASYFAYFELAGIWQPIEVFATSPAYLSHLAVNDRFRQGLSGREACPSSWTPSMQQAAQARSDHPLALVRSAGQGSADRRIRQPKVSLSALGSERRVTLRARRSRSPQSWNAEQPRLYKLVAEMTDSDGKQERDRAAFRLPRRSRSRAAC